MVGAEMGARRIQLRLHLRLRQAHGDDVLRDARGRFAARRHALRRRGTGQIILGPYQDLAQGRHLLGADAGLHTLGQAVLRTVAGKRRLLLQHLGLERRGAVLHPGIGRIERRRFHGELVGAIKIHDAVDRIRCHIRIARREGDRENAGRIDGCHGRCLHRRGIDGAYLF